MESYAGAECSPGAVLVYFSGMETASLNLASPRASCTQLGTSLKEKRRGTVWLPWSKVAWWGFGLWSQSAGCGGSDDGVKRDCSSLPHAPCGSLPDEDRKAVSVGPATWRGSRSFSCVSVMRGTMSSFLSPKGLSGLPSTMEWVGASAWLHWRTGLSYTTDLLQNIWCWRAVK